MKKLGFILLLIVSLLCAILSKFTTGLDQQISGGDTAWMLAASALVLLMTPGLAFFYGGMISRNNVITTMLQSYICMGVISILWVIIGFSLAFGTSYKGLIGNPFTYFMLNNVGAGPNQTFSPTFPFLLFAIFQLKFAIITPALISGAFSERIRFGAFMIFSCLFSIFIYAPLAHWTWHPDGILRTMGILDFAGGTVVHMSAGFAALAGAMILKKSNRRVHEIPANIPFVLLGTGMLWFGWFGFNAGSSLGANGLAALAFINTNTASAAAMIGWILYDYSKGRKLSALNACIGAVVGLVAITPCAGFVSIGESILIGVIASAASNVAVHLRSKTNIDDTLDVFPCHGIGGIVGMLATGFFAHDQGLTSGHPEVFFIHAAGVVAVGAFVFFASLFLYKVTNLIISLDTNTDLTLQSEGENKTTENLELGEAV